MIYIVLIAFIFCCFVYQSLRADRDTRIYWLCSALTLFIMIFRSYDPTLVNYQDDVPDYIDFYNNSIKSNYGIPGDTSFGFEPCLSWFCQLLWLFPKSNLLFIFMMRMVCMAPIIYGIHKYSRQKELSLLFTILLPGCWLLEMITMRQALATSFLLWALFFYLERPHYWKVLVAGLSILAALSHSTSYLVLFIAAIALILPFNKKCCYVLLAVASVSGGFFARKISTIFSLLFSPLGLLERVMSYITDSTEMGSMNYLNFVVIGFLGALCVFAVEKGNTKKELFAKFFVTGTVVYCLLGNYPLVDRMISFFMLAGAIGALPEVPAARDVHKSMNWWFMIMFCYIFIYLFYSHNCGESSVFLPYHFLFDRSLLWMYR